MMRKRVVYKFLFKKIFLTNKRHCCSQDMRMVNSCNHTVLLPVIIHALTHLN